MYWRRLTSALVVVVLAGCSGIGPGTVARDRFDYNTAVSDSWKEQTLLNIVKIRYADMPLFMEVASIVSGYSLESSVNLGGRQVYRSSHHHLRADHRRQIQQELHDPAAAQCRIVPDPVGLAS